MMFCIHGYYDMVMGKGETGDREGCHGVMAGLPQSCLLVVTEVVLYLCVYFLFYFY